MKKKNRDRILSGSWLFFLILVVSQLGKHFWIKESYVFGIRVDYLSPTWYFLDLIWLVVAWGEMRKKQFYFGGGRKMNGGWIVLIAGGLNILFSQRKWISLYGWLRWGQWFWTVGMIERRRKTIWKILEKCIPLWILLEVGLGWSQIFLKRSVGGIWWWLGERNFSLISPGIAKIGVGGVTALRAYGTFSHPNSLAGFLLVSLIMWWGFRKKRGTYQKTWWWTVWWLGIGGLIMTASRTVWLVGAGVGIWGLIREKIRGWKGVVGLGLVGLGLGMTVKGVTDLVGGWDIISVEKRVGLMRMGIKMIGEAPILGVGLKNMVGILPLYWVNEPMVKGWLQPVHNIYILLLAEIGIGGTLVLVWFFRKKLSLLIESGKKEKINKLARLSLLVIGLTGLSDHYWLTLNQNWWLMGIIWGLMK